MNASNLNFYTQYVKSNNPVDQALAFEVLFGKINRKDVDVDEDVYVEELEGGYRGILNPLRNIIPKIFYSYDFLEVYKIASNLIFIHLRSISDETYANVKNLRTWLWSTVTNLITKHEDKIKIELGGESDGFDEKKHGHSKGDTFGNNAIQEDDLNRYLDLLRAAGQKGEYRVRLIESVILSGKSNEEFILEENEFREEYGMLPISDSKAVSRDKYNAILALIQLASDDIKHLRKYAYIKLAQEGRLDDGLMQLEDYCLRDGDLANNDLPLVRRLFDVFNKIREDKTKDSLNYFKQYHWLYNKYDNETHILNIFEEKALNLYFNKGLINNNITFTRAIFKLGNNLELYLKGESASKVEKFRQKHEDICCYKDNPDIIESYFINSYKEYQEIKLERKEEKELEKQKEKNEKQVLALQF